MFDFKLTLEHIASIDVQTLVKKDAEYGSSWKRRGGVGAFMMAARKWDRLETQVTVPQLDSKYDVFDAIEQGVGGTESVLESIRDLRRYLLLIESEIERRENVDNYGSGSDASSPPLTPSKAIPSKRQFEVDRQHYAAEAVTLINSAMDKLRAASAALEDVIV